MDDALVDWTVSCGYPTCGEGSGLEGMVVPVVDDVPPLGTAAEIIHRNGTT